MKQEYANIIIDSFGAWLSDSDAKKVDVATIVNESAKRGYIVDASCADEVALAYVKGKEINPNSTFYKSFNDVISKNRFELFLDQVLHYATTYGTDFQGEVYCPNGEPINIDYNSYKIIKAITRAEMYDKVMQILQAGVALSNDVVEAYCAFVGECVKKGFSLSIDSVKNKTAYIVLCKNLHIIPNTGDGIIRMLAYYATGNAMVVQGKNMYNTMRSLMISRQRATEVKNFIRNMTTEQMIEASKSFLRYKKFWLAIRMNVSVGCRSKINKIRELARKNHQPMVKGFWENLTNLSAVEVAKRLPGEVAKLDNAFKIIKLLEMIKLRWIQSNTRSARMFKIRNGSVWIDNNKFADYPTFLSDVSKMLVDRLVELVHNRMRAISPLERLTVRFNPELSLMCPSSERNFVGNIPYGSYFNLADHDNYLGVYWRNEWGTRDFDLSIIDDQHNKLGWNGSYNSQANSLVFSGDMTSADPEATEMFYASKNAPNGTIYLNRFCGAAGSKFRLFFGQSSCQGFGQNYMVDPNTIKLSIDMVSDSAQQILGRIQDNKVYFCNFGMGNSQVSNCYKNVNESMLDSVKAHVPLREVLLASGFVEWDPESDEPANIDLYDVKKDTILNLFS